MKILHTSDWHLGRIFNQQSLLEDQAHILQQIIACAVAEQVDVVIVAGDVYDRALPPAEAVTLLDRTLNTLISEYQIPVVMISGNHDAAKRLGFGANLLKHSGLHLFTSFEQLLTPVTLTTDAGELVIWGIPYCDPEHVNDFYGVKTTDHQSAQEHVTNLLKQHLADHPNQQATHVVVSHSFIAGASVSESERPLSIGGAECVDANLFKDFHYTALGHLHQAQYRGYQHVRYSGSPLKYSFSEVNHKKSVTLVEFTADQQADISQYPLKPLRDVRIIEGAFAEILERGKSDPYYQDYVQVKLTDKEALLDPMARLRQVYPNILDLTKRVLERSDSEVVKVHSKEQLARTELDIIDDFFHAMTDDHLSAEQRQVLNDVVQDVLNKQKEL
ncbi:MAG: exonuclease SbcCD subunit D [Pseudidiomarina maritima]|nr:exonuclease SbcCD subunit D [Pseudidiomarina maritima]